MFRLPSVFNMSPEDLDTMISQTPGSPTGSDVLLYQNCIPQLLASYRAALFNRTIRAAFPHMKVSYIVDDSTLEFAIVANWSVQTDEAAAGGGFIDRYRLVKGVNHFVSVI